MGDMYWDGEEKSSEKKVKKSYNKFCVKLNLSNYDIVEMNYVPVEYYETKKSFLNKIMNETHLKNSETYFKYVTEDKITDDIKNNVYLEINNFIDGKLKSINKEYENIKNLKKNSNIQKALRESKLKRII